MLLSDTSDKAQLPLVPFQRCLGKSQLPQRRRFSVPLVLTSRTFPL